MFEGSDAGSVSLLDLLSCMLGGAAILFVTFVAISTRLERGNSGSPERPVAMTDFVKIEIPNGSHLGKASVDPQPASQSRHVESVAIYELAFNSDTTMVSLSGSGCVDDRDVSAVFDGAVVTWFHDGTEYVASRDAVSCNTAGHWTASYRRDKEKPTVSLDETCRGGWLGESKLVAARVEAPEYYMIFALSTARSQIEGCRLAAFSAGLASHRDHIKRTWGMIAEVVAPREEEGSTRAALQPWVEVALDVRLVEPIVYEGPPPGPLAPLPDPNAPVRLSYDAEFSREQSETKGYDGYTGTVELVPPVWPGEVDGLIDSPVGDGAVIYVEDHARRALDSPVRFQSVGNAVCSFVGSNPWPSICYVAMIRRNPAR